MQHRAAVMKAAAWRSQRSQRKYRWLANGEEK
jgi:hypothetical protein